MDFKKDLQYKKFCTYGFLKNLKFFEPFILIYFRTKGFSFLEIGVLYTIREIFSNILEIPTGIAADVFGRRKSMIFSFISYIASFLIFYISANYIAFIFGMIFFAFGEAFRSGTHKAIILTYLKLQNMEDKKVSYYGHTRSWSQKGSALSALIAAGLVFYSGNYEYIFIFSIIPYLFDLILMLTYPPELDGDIKKLKDIAFKPAIKKGIVDFWELSHNKAILGAILNGSVYSGFYKAVKDYIQPIMATLALSISIPWLKELGHDKKLALVTGGIYFILYIFTSTASKNAGNFLKKFKDITFPLNMTLIIGFSLGILMGLFSFANWIILSIIVFIFLAIIQNLRRPLVVSNVSDVIKKDVLASALSFESQITTLISALLAPIIGFLADYFGPQLGISLISVFFILLSPLYFAKKRKVWL